MKKFMTALIVLSLVLGGVAVATSADLTKTPMGMELSGFQKITDQEAQEIRGTGFSWGYQSGFGGYDGLGNPDCPQTQTEFITSVPQTRTMYHNNSSALLNGIKKQDRVCPPAP
jgi:hypothetical protein